ncbi:MAG: ISAs1 family transposase [Brooklawnia sp.]|nr:ISAs1 family transposase [Brooklawnia sp.]
MCPPPAGSIAVTAEGAGAPSRPSRPPAWIDYPGTRQVLRIRRTRTINGKRHTEVVFLLCSKSMLQAQPEQVADWIQGHWHVENRLHWVRDVSHGEDRQQLRTGNGPAVMASMRNLAITLLRLAGWDNIAEACRYHSRHLERTVNLLLTT